jgi:hypothetical protein
MIVKQTWEELARLDAHLDSPTTTEHELRLWIDSGFDSGLTLDWPLHNYLHRYS